MGNKQNVNRYILVVFALFVLITLLFPNQSFAISGNNNKITLVYFYENVCGACNPEAEFIELFNQLVGEDKEGVEVELLMYNVFHDSSLKLMNEYYKDYNVPEDKQSRTMVFIGDTYLSGQGEIESRLRDEFVKAKESILEGLVNTVRSPASDSSPPLSSTPIETSELTSQTIIYFHVTACSSCLEVERFLDTIQGIDVLEYNISLSENLGLIKEYFKTYEVPEKDQSVPIIFIGDTYLSGEKAIKGSLVNKIEEGQGFNTLVLNSTGDESRSNYEGLSGYGVIGVLLTGFVNGLNPCSISMLLFFLSMLTMRGVSALKMGFAFIVGKFIIYFLLGTLLFNIFIKLDIPWFQTSIKIIMAILLFLIAIFNVGDLFAARKEDYSKVRMQLPAFLRKKNHQWIKRFSSIENHKILLPISFALGALISVGEFLCTGQIYLATIISVLQESKTLDFRAITYFLLYGCAFILPLILITVLIHKGRELFDLTEWFREKMPIIKVINAIVFILFGILTLVWF